MTVVVYSRRLPAASHSGSFEKDSVSPLTVTSSSHTSPPVSCCFMIVSRPQRLNVAPSALCPVSRWHTDVSPPSVAVILPVPPLPAGSYFSDQSSTFAPVGKPRSRIRPCLSSSDTSAKPPGVSPPDRH